jgi:hypothetical protein
MVLSWRIAIVSLIGLFSLIGILAFRKMWMDSSGPRRWIQLVCFAIVAYGGGAFLTPFAASAGGLWFVGPQFEWPVGVPEEVVEDSGGRRIVALMPMGRIQVYTRAGVFERGWFIDASGGTFTTRIMPDDRIEVFTARGRQRFVYSPNGDLAESGPYRGDFSSIAKGSPVEMRFHTPLLLWPFANPITAWVVLVVGIISLKIDQWSRLRSSQQ